VQFSEWIEIREGKKQKKAKRDKCYYKVKAKMDVWPSAYGSGLLMQCREKGADNWGNSRKKKKRKKKNENNEFMTFSDYLSEFEPETNLPELNEEKFKLEKDRGLRGWFDRNHGKGWIDCKASKKGKLVPCGRKKAGRGAERKYPACRPTLSMCNKSKHKKKSSKPISWEKKD
jgi:hypothetical protein